MHKLLFDRLQFVAPLYCGFGIGHPESPQRIMDDLGDDQPRVLFIVGGYHIPRRMISARCMKAVFVGLHLILPVFPLVDVRGAELPVLFGLVDAREESLSLLFAGKVEKYLDHLRAVAMKVLLQINN